MPIVIPRDLPAFDVLNRENIFVMTSARAKMQDIRPIELAIVNLMPTKVETETQIMRLLGNSPLQINVTLIRTRSYTGTHISSEHLERFYQTFDEVKNQNFDGLIVTGAPVETMEFEQVKYWDELKEIMDFADKRVTSSLFICWGAQAALKFYYGIEKVSLPQKMFGIFPFRAVNEYEQLLKGMDDTFYVPMSRNSAVDEKQLAQCRDIKILAANEKYGAAIAKSNDDSKFFFFGHSEYDRETLDREYRRDLAKGLKISAPVNYYNADGTINFCWKSTANLLFYNWLNYYVYQVTPYDFAGR